MILRQQILWLTKTIRYHHPPLLMGRPCTAVGVRYPFVNEVEFNDRPLQVNVKHLSAKNSTVTKNDSEKSQNTGTKTTQANIPV